LVFQKFFLKKIKTGQGFGCPEKNDEYLGYFDEYLGYFDEYLGYFDEYLGY